MDHCIAEGDRLFADTPYANTWWLFHDHLSAWWETEAQEYLAERGFADRQVRAWGETNGEYWRYAWSLVGNRPELMPLDSHLFSDWETDLIFNIVATSSKPKGPAPEDPGRHGRFDDGTPTELESAMRRTWAGLDSARIVQDISRLPRTIKAIIEAKGGVVPDEQLRGCSRRKGMVRAREEGVAAAVKERCVALRAKARSDLESRGE